MNRHTTTVTDRTGTMNSPTNPMAPSSVAALLSEEWMILPQHSAFPSFVELMMIQDADHAVTKTIQATLQVVADRLQLYIQRRQLHHHTSNIMETENENRQDPTTAGFWKMAVALAQQHLDRLRTNHPQLLGIQLAVAVEQNVRRHSAEIGCFLRYYLERRSLQLQKCTLAESFYGTVRVKAQQQQSQSNDFVQQKAMKLVPLETLDQARLALFLALGPFLREKLQTLYTRWKEQNTAIRRTAAANSSRSTIQHPSDTVRRKMRNLLVKLVPLGLASVQVSNVYCQWRYLMGLSHFSDLRNLLLQQVMRRKTQQDTGNSGARTSTAPKTVDTNANNTAWQTTLLCVAGSAMALSWLTQLRSWYMERYHERVQPEQGSSLWIGGTAAPVIPPPPPLQLGDSSGNHSGGCPLCGKTSRILPTACASSGYVYCLPCIRPFVQEHGTCPVSGKPVAMVQLVRLFEPTEWQTNTARTSAQ